jgi:hypothetical protein
MQDNIDVDRRAVDFMFIQPNKEVILTKPYCEIHIPEDYISHNIAELIGNEIDTFGLFNIYVWDDYDIEHTKPRTFFFKFPSRIRTAPSVIDTRRGKDGEKIRVLKYEEGDILIKSVAIQENSDVARQMLDIMFNAYLPDTIPYNNIYSFWTRVNIFNGVKPAANEAILKIIISEICRDPDDLSRPFRHYLRDKFLHGGVIGDMSKRKMLNIRNIPKYNSTFASVTSGNAKQGITSSIARIRSGKIDKDSPIEKAIE